MLLLLLLLNVAFFNGICGVFDVPSQANWTSGHVSAIPDDLQTESAAVGIGRFLGYGYDILYGDPFSAKLDSGLKRNSLLPSRIVQTFYLQVNATCPHLGQCLHPHQPEIVDFSLYEKCHDDYRKVALHHIDIYGKSSSNISSGFGISSKRSRETSLRLEGGTLSVEHIRLTISQESNLDYRQTKHLHPAFVAAICELPIEYHYDDYANVLKEFGTHVVVKVRQALVSTNRTLLNLTMLRQTARQHIGFDMVEMEKDGQSGFDPTAIPIHVLQKAAENQGLSDETKLEDELPVVVSLRELAYFVTRERLTISESEAGECSAILRPPAATEDAVNHNVDQLRSNLQLALIDYVTLAKEVHRPYSRDCTNGIVPFPNQADSTNDTKNKSVKHLCGEKTFLSQCGKAELLGVGYDIFRGDPLEPSHDPGFLPLPHLLVHNPRFSLLYDSDSDLCSETFLSHSTKYRKQIWNSQDYTQELNRHYNFLQPLPVAAASLLSTKSSSMADIRSILHIKGQNLLSDLITINASCEMLLNYRAVNALASEFVHALCELPSNYQVEPYVNLLKEFGTHIVTRVRLGNLTIERVVLQHANLVRSIVNDRQAERGKPSTLLDSDPLSTKEILAAVRRFIQSHKLNGTSIQQQVTIDKNNEPVLMTLRDISYFVTSQRLANSLIPKGSCAHLLGNQSNVEALRSNLEKALIDYGQEVRPVETTTSTSTTTLATTTSRVTVLQSDADRKSTWPAGTYALLEPVEGCPSSQWNEGSRLQDTEDFGHGNSWSRNFPTLTASLVSGGGLQLSFCVKPEAISENEPQWPSGSYCILKKGDCPSAFRTSYVHFDDEDVHNHNRMSGTLPDGIFNRDTRYYFCCRDDGNPFLPMELPTRKPFILMQNGFVCQSVKGMDVTPLWLLVDCEDSRSGCHASTFGYSLPGTRNVHGDFRWNFCRYSPSFYSLPGIFDPFRSLLLGI